MGGGFGGKVLCLLETDIIKKEKIPENAKKRLLRFQGFLFYGRVRHLPFFFEEPHSASFLRILSGKGSLKIMKIR